MTDASALLRAAGEALYGPRWQSELARDLGVSDRTMRRWVAGTAETPAALRAELAQLIRQRIKTLEAALRGLSA